MEVLLTFPNIDYMKQGDLLYVRYIGNIRHWNRDLFPAPISCLSNRYVTVTINGKPCRFDRATLRHDNRGHSPSYELFPTVAAYEQAAERAALRNLMGRTDFTRLPFEKQRAIKAILDT